MFYESSARSLLKSASWRILGTLITVGIVWVLTRRLVVAAGIGGLEAGAKTLLFYLHERGWDAVRFGKKQVQPAVIWFTGLSGSGKSTILQALLYLHELLERGNADVDRTELGGSVLELGGFSAFLYAIEARELLTDRVTELTGARLTTSYGRIGGLNRDLPAGWEEKVLKSLIKLEELLDETDKLLTRNRIFTDRMRGTGVITSTSTGSPSSASVFGM